MKKINIIYNYEYDDVSEQLTIQDDVDIVYVPDCICDNLEQNVQEFFNWTNCLDSGCWKEINGALVCSVDTEDFIRWINQTYPNLEAESAFIVKQHTKYNSQYPIAEF